MPVFDPPPLTDQQRVDWLRLIRTPYIGPLTFYRIMDHFDGDAAQALTNINDLAKQAGKKPYKLYPESRAKQEIDALHKYGGRMVMACEPTYPDALKMIEDAPPVLSVIGDITKFKHPSVAIVGARNASINGKRMAFKLAETIGQANYIITSGLARGIDTSAHDGALPTGTIAVLAGGVDNIYPPENKDLYAKICESGLIVSENALGMVPKAQHFPRRNRIVSGLSLGTVVVEAAIKSGSLITARLAFEQGREVFAVPGSPADPRAGGPNQLIKREQARLITQGEDVLKTLASMTPKIVEPTKRPALWEEPLEFTLFNDADNDVPAVHDVERPAPNVSSNPMELIDYLSATPTEIDDLAYESGQPIHKILTFLLELELQGRIQRHSGNKVSLIEAA